MTNDTYSDIFMWVLRYFIEIFGALPKHIWTHLSILDFMEIFQDGALPN